MKFFFYMLLPFLFMYSCVEKESPQHPEPSTQKEVKAKTLIDLSHDYSAETIYWVTAKEFQLDTVFQGDTDKGFYYAANNFSTAEHGGTHIDAPIHFSKNGQTVDEIPLEKLIGPAVKIDVSERAFTNPDYLISIQDFLDWEEKENIQIPEGSIVLLQTNYSKYYPAKLKYLGTEDRGLKAIKLLHFPWLSPETAT